LEDVERGDSLLVYYGDEFDESFETPEKYTLFLNWISVRKDIEPYHISTYGNELLEKKLHIEPHHEGKVLIIRDFEPYVIELVNAEYPEDINLALTKYQFRDYDKFSRKLLDSVSKDSEKILVLMSIDNVQLYEDRAIMINVHQLKKLNPNIIFCEINKLTKDEEEV